MTRPADSDAPVEHGVGCGFDSAALRRALGQFATGVTIVTAADPKGGPPVGMTANSFSSVSLEPPLILWSVTRTALSLPVFRRASHFAVNVLAAEQIELASRFARAGEDKFAGVGWNPGLGDAPILPQLSALFECRRAAEHDGGDHVILVGQVERFGRWERPGLAFAAGRYGIVAEHPTVPEPTPAARDGGEPDPYEGFLIPLLFRAYGALSSAFSVELEGAGSNGPEMRVLAYLSIRPESTVEAIMRAAYLGEGTVEAALDHLAADGYVIGDPVLGYELTRAGRERLRGLIRMAEAFEAEHLGVPVSEMERIKAVLRRLAAEGRSALRNL